MFEVDVLLNWLINVNIRKFCKKITLENYFTQLPGSHSTFKRFENSSFLNIFLYILELGYELHEDVQ